MTATGSAALEVALAWYQARIGHDIDKIMSCAADDIVVDAPGAHLEEARPSATSRRASSR